MIRYAKNEVVEVNLTKAATLAEALPYLKKFSEKLVVVKVGGELLLDSERAQVFAEDIILLHSVGFRVVLCHGGGPQINKMMERLDLKPSFEKGQRVTDASTLEVTAMVLLGEVNRKLVALINKVKTCALGISGIDAGIITVKQGDESLGYVGTVEVVRTEPIYHLLDGGFIPVIASLGSDIHGATFNINADLVAGEMASRLRAEKLVLITNVPGLYESFEDKNSLISEIDAASLRTLRDQGLIEGGMLPKITSILTALEGGVGRAHILNGLLDHALLLEFFTEHGIGTMIYP
jgi:acetylglutamate kinase